MAICFQTLLSCKKIGPMKIGASFESDLITDSCLKHVTVTCIWHKLNVLSTPNTD